jgi:hypothetical protein
MYERKVKKGPNKGKMGWGCPCCFMMLPEDEPQIGYVMDMLEDIYITIEGKDIDTLKHLLSEEDTDEPFDFWQKPSQDKEDGK